MGSLPSRPGTEGKKHAVSHLPAAPLPLMPLRPLYAAIHTYTHTPPQPSTLEAPALGACSVATGHIDRASPRAEAGASEEKKMEKEKKMRELLQGGDSCVGLRCRRGSIAQIQASGEKRKVGMEERRKIRNRERKEELLTVGDVSVEWRVGGVFLVENKQTCKQGLSLSPPIQRVRRQLGGVKNANRSSLHSKP